MEISEEITNALRIAKAIASENSNQKFGAAHLLKALLHKDIGLFSQITAWGEDPYFIEEWAEVRLESYPKGRLFSEPEGDESIDQIFVEAENISVKLGKEAVDPISLLAAISTPGVGFNYEQLKTFPLNQQLILANVQSTSTVQKAVHDAVSNDNQHKLPAGNLLKYCEDLIQSSSTGSTEVFIGRNQELISISEILCRKSKPNVIITGEAGIGKTALIRGLAKKIQEGNIPQTLKNARLFALDHNALLAGVSYKGELEDRFRGILQDLSRFDVPLLFIDDIHQMFDTSLGLRGVVNIIKGELAKKSFVLLATTLSDEYRKKLEPDTSLMRWCEVLPIYEPQEEACSEIVAGVIAAYESHHLVQLEENVIKETIKLCKRYIKEKNMPDAAIDVLDRTMAALQFMHNMAPGIAASFESQLGELKASDPADEAYEKLYKLLLGSLNYLAISEIDEDTKSNQAPEKITKEKISNCISRLRALSEKEDLKVTVSHVAATISKICGIPAGKILSGERERLHLMESHLCKKVIGQDHAVQALADSILESRSGLTKAGQPIGSFFLLGPTGTGKTELAKQLADFLFQSTQAFIRFDMSEFKEEHSAALLYGAPPGYVGYEEGGLLVNKIRQQPYSVVLFDEIEKAHSSVFDLFLQILDEGKITDKLGRQGDFSNAVILFTSNIGSKQIAELSEKENALPDQTTLSSLMSRFFRPEFLGRLSGIVPFSPIKKENVIKILKLNLKELEDLLENQGIKLLVSDDAAEKLATEGYSPDYGARPLRSVIRKYLKTPLSRMIIAGKLNSGDVVEAQVNAKGEVDLICNAKEAASGGQSKTNRKPKIDSKNKLKDNSKEPFNVESQELTEI